VTDMVDGLVRLMRTGPEMSLVNLGHEQSIKIGEVARIIIEMTESSSQVVTEDPMVFITSKGLPDLTRAKEDLGWIPLFFLKDGLKKMIDYTLANKEALDLNR